MHFENDTEFQSMVVAFVLGSIAVGIVMISILG